MDTYQLGRPVARDRSRSLSVRTREAERRAARAAKLSAPPFDVVALQLELAAPVLDSETAR